MGCDLILIWPSWIRLCLPKHGQTFIILVTFVEHKVSRVRFEIVLYSTKTILYIVWHGSLLIWFMPSMQRRQSHYHQPLHISLKHTHIIIQKCEKYHLDGNNFLANEASIYLGKHHTLMEHIQLCLNILRARLPHGGGVNFGMSIFKFSPQCWANCRIRA